MLREIYLAGGCFWGMEKYLSLIDGVRETSVGYANSNMINPSYEQVCSGATDSAEAVRVAYDSDALSLDFLLGLYFEAIDPTSVNRQGPDVGTRYRSGIYYVDSGDLPQIERAIAKAQSKYDAPVAVEALPLRNFFPAEPYHQRYLDKHPGGYCHISRTQFERAAQATMRPARTDEERM